MLAAQRPYKGKLAPEVEKLTAAVVEELANADTEGVNLYLEMLSTHPVIGTVFDVMAMLAWLKLGEYSHPDEEKQRFIQENFEQMKGSLKTAFAEMCICHPLGYNFSEIAIAQVDGKYKLESLMAVDPRLYKFIGAQGRVTGLRYEGKDVKVDIPIERGIHTVSRSYLSFGDPYGVAACRRAVAPWRAWKILSAQMVIAGQRQATPIIVGQSSSADSVPLYGADGQPLRNAANEVLTIPAPEALGRQLADLENGSVLSTDLQNKIYTLSQQTDGGFFAMAIAQCEQWMLLSFGFPETVLSTGGNGTGDSNLNKGHQVILDAQVSALVEQITEAILEQIVRPLLVWNFGEQETFGEFVKEEANEEKAMAIAKTLLQAVQAGYISTEDQSALDYFRGLIGLPAGEAVAQQFSAPVSYWKGND